VPSLALCTAAGVAVPSTVLTIVSTAETQSKPKPASLALLGISLLGWAPTAGSEE